jgi:hypothetical protein
MPDPRISATWLSDDMAHALAAMSPPLESTDVEQAADQLTLHAAEPLVVDGLLRRNLDLLEARRVVEALRALRDFARLDPPRRVPTFEPLRSPHRSRTGRKR